MTTQSDVERGALMALSGVLSNLSDDAVRDLVAAFVKGVLVGIAEKLADRVTDSVLTELTALVGPDAAAAAPDPAPAAVPEPSPREQQVVDAIAAHPRQDTVQHTCSLCGRVGSRRFTTHDDGWRCTETDACARRRQTAGTPPKTSPGLTARCRDCPRTWTLTGMLLDQAVEIHEAQRSHVVEVLV